MSWSKNHIKYLRNTAVRSLFPDGQFNVSAEGVVEFLDGNSVTEEEIVAEEKKILKEYEDSKYQRDRANAYDPISEQLDQIYHDMDGWKKRIKSVKDKYPKP